MACENAKDPNALLTVTDEMVKKYNASYNASKEDGPSVAISWKSGYQVTMEDALHMIIYESDTYACWLVANSVAGSEEGFVALMNAKAKSLNIDTTTHFENVTGLYHDNHYTTCLDMAAIMAAASAASRTSSRPSSAAAWAVGAPTAPSPATTCAMT